MVNQITLVSNICFEPYWQTYIDKYFTPFDLNFQSNFVLYDEYREQIASLTNANFVVVALNFDTFYPNISITEFYEETMCDAIINDCVNKCKTLLSFIKTHTNCHIIWLGFEDYFAHEYIMCGNLPVFGGIVDKINALLFGILEVDTFIDLKHLIAQVGVSVAYENKGKYRWNAPYSKALISLICKEIQKQYLIHAGISKKCLVLDCDNVLWGGILSEDGIEHIHLANYGFGRPYQDFQRFVLTMFNHGVILTICSKNNKEDVLKVFHEHSGMILQEEHISCFCCNWDKKCSNIEKIANKLNIGLDSMVFIDDSKFEIEAAKSLIPEVTSIQYNRDTIYQNLSCFNLSCKANNQLAKQRTETYKTNIMREDLMNRSNSIDDYLSSLNMKINIHEALDQDIGRISELTQRTNKCTNGVRYSVGQLKEKIASPKYKLFVVQLSDKFSNLGIVGAIGKYGNTIDLFSLSCRALGRKIEEKMMKHIIGKGVTKVRFISTNKNEDLLLLLKANNLIIEKETRNTTT